AHHHGRERRSTRIPRQDPASPGVRGDGPRDGGDLRGGVRRGPAPQATLRRHARAGMARALTARRSAPGVWRLARHFGPHLTGQWLLVLASLGALFAEAGLQLLEP